MTVSTLLVGLNELSLNQLTQVVNARGIERVIVVANNSDFNDPVALANLGSSEVVALRGDGVEFKLASDNGNILTLSNSNYNTIRASNFDFLTTGEFQSLTSATTIVSGSLLAGASSTTVFPAFDPTSSNQVSTYTTVTASDNASGFGSKQEVQAESGSFTALDDFNGSVQLNISAGDFINILSTANSTANVTDLTNIVAADGATPVDQEPNIFDFYRLYDDVVPEYDGTNRIGNLTTNPSDDSHTAGLPFIFSAYDAPQELNALQALALPLQGIYNNNYPFPELITSLVDTPANIAAVLPQLSTGQLQTFQKIVLADVTNPSAAPLNISASTLYDLNTFSDYVNINGTVGIDSITIEDGETDAHLHVSGNVTDLYDAATGISGHKNYTSQVTIVDAYANSYTDFALIESIENSVADNSDFNVYATNLTLTVQQLESIVAIKDDVGFDLSYTNVVVNDSETNIQSLFETDDDSLITALR